MSFYPKTERQQKIKQKITFLVEIWCITIYNYRNRPHFLDEVEAQHLTVYSGVWGNDDTIKKEMLPKPVITSLLLAGSVVN